MASRFTVLLGKSVRYAARLRGGGSALPGLFVEKIDKHFVPNTLKSLPYGVVVISGTNGKTTTTKMVVSLLESTGLRVFTNRTGSNFIRGVAAALLADVDMKGKLHADIAVLELDEAHAVKFVDLIKPQYSLLLNVMRDQLDRFGEIDATARMLEKIAQATEKTVVANREDNRIRTFCEALPATSSVAYFGLGKEVRSAFPTDDELHAHKVRVTAKLPETTVSLTAYTDSSATYTINGKGFSTTLALKGAYNIFNSAAALALTIAIKPDASPKALMQRLGTITPAFGRGESFEVDGQPLELILVKNPSGFRLGLRSFSPKGVATMIAVNDNYADGRDMSWLWDVDFTSLQANPVAVSGLRTYDIALRLDYDRVLLGICEPSLRKALRSFIANNATTPKRIYATYTAMLTIRKELAAMTHVEVIT